MTASQVVYPERIDGDSGLVLLPWSADLVRQLAKWGERGFPYRAFDTAYLRERSRAEATLEWALSEGRHRHFIACEGNVAVGRVSVNLQDPAGLYIWAVHVPPEHEGRGVARRMLETLIGWLETEEPERDFVLTVNGFAERAQALYRSLGFTIADTRWQFDVDLGADMWAVSEAERRTLGSNYRLAGGRWEIRVHVMRRPNRGTVG
ncbi:MAG TPA: GNAT family N-acetyltransferase [Tepidiformaceae bacterium]|nr:GNAT family N-acetyltransferase [Tepidiformaceae bacterium]